MGVVHSIILHISFFKQAKENKRKHQQTKKKEKFP
jgi:hypothetical protein